MGVIRSICRLWVYLLNFNLNFAFILSLLVICTCIFRFYFININSFSNNRTILMHLDFIFLLLLNIHSFRVNSFPRFARLNCIQIYFFHFHMKYIPFWMSFIVIFCLNFYWSIRWRFIYCSILGLVTHIWKKLIYEQTHLFIMLLWWDIFLSSTIFNDSLVIPAII